MIVFVVVNAIDVCSDGNALFFIYRPDRVTSIFVLWLRCPLFVMVKSFCLSKTKKLRTILGQGHSQKFLGFENFLYGKNFEEVGFSGFFLKILAN